MELQKIVSPFRTIFGAKKMEDAGEKKRPMPSNVELEKEFPLGYHVYGLTQGPNGDSEVIVGAGDPANALGAVFIGRGRSEWKKVELPDETAFLNTFVRLKDGRYVAGGMSSIGRGAILVSDAKGDNWKSIDTDLHSYSGISTLFQAPDGSLIAAAGQMITQGKTKPVLFRSQDDGLTWAKEELKLPISMILSSTVSENGTLYLGVAGDHTPALYRSNDSCRTFEALPEFPSHKTFKMISVREVEKEGVRRLLVVLWGYKTDIADRVVRIYMLRPDGLSWEEMPEIGDSHFLFSFLIARDGTFYAGSEKGKVYRSTNCAQSWEVVTQFPTNIGAYAMHEDATGRIWIGKDFVWPHEYSLWRLK